MLKTIHDFGVRPDHAYSAALVSVGLSAGSWAFTRIFRSKPQSDRWGLFIGEWAPTFFGLGLALAELEKREKKKS